MELIFFCFVCFIVYKVVPKKTARYKALQKRLERENSLFVESEIAGFLSSQNAQKRIIGSEYLRVQSLLAAQSIKQKKSLSIEHNGMIFGVTYYRGEVINSYIR